MPDTRFGWTRIINIQISKIEILLSYIISKNERYSGHPIVIEIYNPSFVMFEKLQ